MLGHREYLDFAPMRREWIRPPDRKGHMRYLEPRAERRESLKDANDG